MANKYYDNIGFAIPTETSPGIWENVIQKHPYYGDIMQDHMRPKSAEKVIDDITISNEISIVSDPFAIENFHSIVYACYMGTKWKVTSVDVRYPRLTLTLGGVYNGKD